MATHDDQPWRVFAGRPAPLADLFRSQNARRRGAEAHVEDEDEDEDLEEGQGPPGDAGTPPPPPDSVD
jgi:hypothetical protein